MKKLGIVIIVIVILLVGIVLARDVIAKNAVSTGVKVMTGLNLNIGSINVGIFKSAIGIKNLKLQNPSGFEDKLMVDMPEIYVDYDLGAILNKQVHLEEVKINLKEFTVVKNAKGELNLDSLKVVQEKKTPPSEEKREKGEFKIDVLQLKISKVVFKDYSQGKSPKTMEFDLNLDERYENIIDANKLISLIVTRALMNTTISKLANFDLGPLQKEAGEILEGATKAAKEATEKAAEQIKNIIPFKK
ncbi:MAG: AsmA family protein [Candidatus Ratteibacteria bacterium]|nr:AsmA family protein [Candidatus Ratteibacteria bacterium]